MSTKMNYTPNEMIQLLKDTFAANDRLISIGEIPVSIGIVGEHGIGKSEVSKQACIDTARPFYKLNVGQLTEPAELLGQIKGETMLFKDGEEIWVTENLIPTFVSQGYKYMGKWRTVNCAPEWISNLTEGSVLILDDVTRGNPLIMQAVMELVNSHEMIGWNLKDKKIQIVINENPQDGEYNVASLDTAQTSRYVQAQMVWNEKDWAEWAERRGTPGVLINFVLWKPETYKNLKKDGLPSNYVAPRMLDKFISLIGGFEDLQKNMDKIVKFGDISVGINVVNDLKEFIKGELDKLPTWEELLTKFSLKEAKKKLTDVCGVEGKNGWKHALSAILAIRGYNYVKFNGSKLSKDECKQYLEMVMHSCFSNDHKYVMVTNVLEALGDNHSILFEDDRIAKFILN